MPDTDVVLMMRASTVLPAFDCSRQYAAAQRLGAKVPLRWTSMTASHSSSVMFDEHAVAQDAGVVDERRARSPNVSIAVLTSRCAPSQSATLVAVGDGLAAHRP